MKQKLLSALLMSAFAGVATTASAGVIQASYKNFAAEIFGADVAMTVPVIGYSLAQPLTGSAANPNQFEITWTLTDGEWDALNLPSATLVSTQAGTTAGLGPVGIAGTVTKVSAKVLKASFVLNQGTSYPVNSQIVLGQVTAQDAAGVAIVTTNGKIGAVNTILRVPADNACSPTTAQVGVTVKMTNAAGVEFESNFSAAPLSNTTPILQSGVALRASVVSSSTYTTAETSQVNVLNPALGKSFTNTGDVTLAATDKINLGQVRVSTLNTLYDLNGDVFHRVSDADWNAGVAADGGVSQNGLTVKVTGKFATDGVVFLSTNADCTGAALNGVANTFNTGFTEATVSLTKAEYNTVAAVGEVRSVNVCYSTAGTKVIPTASFSVAAGSSSIAKVGGSNEIATPVCPGAMYDLTANGVRVDVRNYIPQIVEAASGGWKSIVRIINTDESQPSVDVIGTALLRNGDLGATAVLKAGMKPREVVYLQSKDIDPLLNAAATATAKTFGADDMAANARLRITAASASIRVQNYHYNPATGNFFEASSAQGDDGVINAAAPTVADVIRARADGQNK